MSLSKKWLVCGDGFNWESDNIDEAKAKALRTRGLLYERCDMWIAPDKPLNAVPSDAGTPTSLNPQTERSEESGKGRS